MNQLNNTWHEDQPKGKKNRFQPKWDKDTVLWIISQLDGMVDFADIQYQLVKDYEISMASASNWIEMSQRVMKDLRNGLDIEAALDRDRERRNLRRRKNKELKRTELTEQQVIEIRKKCDEGIPQVTVANEYGIAQSTVSSIVNKTRWKDA